MYTCIHSTCRCTCILYDVLLFTCLHTLYMYVPVSVSSKVHVHVCIFIIYYMYMYVYLYHLLPVPVGVQLLKVFQKEYSEKEKEKQELTNAEKLFDLPITMFPGMVDVDKELRNIAKVYDIYESQRVCYYYYYCIAPIYRG